MDNTEKRQGYTKTQFRTETKPDEKALIIRGYAIIFNEFTEVYDRENGFYKEMITREALEKTDLSDVYLLFGHDYKNVLGHTRANLRLEIDETGLFYEAELPNTREARDVFNLVEEKKYLNREQGGSIVDGNSFGFYSDDEVTDGVRIVRNLILDEISIVPRPAYLNACSVANRQAEVEKVEHQQSEIENEKTEVEHQQKEEALKIEQAEKLKKLEEM